MKGRDGLLCQQYKNCIYEIKSPLILQPGPAALTDGLDKLVQIFDLYDRGMHDLAY